ncbi:MAG TPA: hypothetical protein DEH11_20025 [Actinobacteria bacterium]|nr:hypothetical protein [Actinomycetota bacterium]
MRISGPVPTNCGRGALAEPLVGCADQRDDFVSCTVDGLNWQGSVVPSDPVSSALTMASALISPPPVRS